MRILYFTNNYFPRQSGVAFSIDCFRRNLEKSGHQIFVVAPQYDQENCFQDKNIIRVKSIKFKKKTFSLPLLFLSMDKILNLVKKIEPDIIHLHHPYLLGLAGQKIAKKMKIPCVFTYHSLYEHYLHYYFPINSKFLRSLVRKSSFNFCRECEMIIAPTNLIKQYLQENNVKTPIRVIPTGLPKSINENNFSASILKKYRDKFGIPRNHKILLNVGRVAVEKGTGFLLRAFKKVVEKNNQVTLLIVGGGDQINYYKKMANQLSLENNLVWAGFTPRHQIAPLYYLADFFIFTSYCDTQAIALYESLATGLPIVATKSLAAEEIISRGKNGVIVERNIASLSYLLLNFLNNKPEIKISFSKEKYAEEAVTDQLIAVYQELLVNYSCLERDSYPYLKSYASENNK